MNRHILAALFLVGFLLLAVPLLLLQHSGLANASLISGLMCPLENIVHCLCLVGIGCMAALLAREMLVLLPLCGMLMMLIGAFSTIEVAQFIRVREFTVGAILLFALATSMMRHRLSLLSIVPIAGWAYFTGVGYMHNLPVGIHPLYYIIGMAESASLLMAIGVVFSVMVMGVFGGSLGRLRTVSVVISFFALF